MGVAQAVRSRVGSLVAALGNDLLRPLHIPPEPAEPIGEPVIWDTEAELPPAPHAVLLLVGGRPSVPAARDALAAAARLGYAAVVVKAYGEDPARWQDYAARAGIAALLVPDDTPWRHLDSMISAVVASEVDLSAPARSQVAMGDLFALANAVAAMVGSAVTIEDVERRLLAYSNLADQPIDTCRRQAILGRQVRDDPLHLDEYRELARSNGIVRIAAHPEHDDDLPRLAVPVRAGSRPLGSIWAINSNGIDLAQAEQALTSAARIAAPHLLHGSPTIDQARRQRSEWLTGLLGAGGLVAGTRPQFPVGPDHLAVLVGFAEQSPTGELLDTARILDLVTMFCQALRRDAASATIGDTVFALLPAATTPRDKLAFLARQIVDSARASLGVGLIAAIGDPAGSVPEVLASRSEVEVGLRALRRRPERGPVLDIGTNQQVLRLEELTEAARSRWARPLPVLARIQAYDRAHETAYLATLRAHLDSSGDSLAAARQLLVHVNTFRYRVRRLTELFALDLSDPELRLVAWLQLRTLHQFQ